jgi:hypothetical protein
MSGTTSLTEVVARRAERAGLNHQAAADRSLTTARRQTRVIRKTRPLPQVNEAIADVEASHVAALIVLEPSPRHVTKTRSDGRFSARQTSSDKDRR